MKGHTGLVYGAMVLPDGRLLSWSSDGCLRLWDGQTGALLAELSYGEDAARARTLGGDDRHVSTPARARRSASASSSRAA